MSGPMLKHSPTCEWLRRRCNCGAAARAAAPLDREALWEKWTAGEKLAYGCGVRDARTAAPLDVERLARALHGENNAGGKFDGARCPCRKEAERVAAEYARLSGGDSDGGTA